MSWKHLAQVALAEFDDIVIKPLVIHYDFNSRTECGLIVVDMESTADRSLPFQSDRSKLTWAITDRIFC